MKHGPFLRSFRLENFKAVQKSGIIPLSPLTVLIGNNGSGKSSLIEGLETYRDIIVSGLDTAMKRWYGMGHVWNKHARHNLIAGGAANETFENPIRFDACGKTSDGPYRTNMLVTPEPGLNGFAIQEELINDPLGKEFIRDRSGACLMKHGDSTVKLRNRLEAGESAMPTNLRSFITQWQFLSLQPEPMGRPSIKQMSASRDVMLHRDGSNLAQYLLRIREKDAGAFEGIIEAMQFVLDYARNIEPVETREIQPTMYLKMLEQKGGENVEIPGWLMSTGSLRILALLAVLRNPDPPPLIVIEEVENGLDPRTINLVIEEIRTAVESRKTQVIMTTHSPYLLDLLDLSHIVLCERVDGRPTFSRPQDNKGLMEWSRNFAPGQLYVMDRLHAEARR
jgi:predicted ATPase